MLAKSAPVQQAACQRCGSKRDRKCQSLTAMRVAYNEPCHAHFLSSLIISQAGPDLRDAESSVAGNGIANVRAHGTELARLLSAASRTGANHDIVVQDFPPPSAAGERCDRA